MATQSLDRLLKAVAAGDGRQLYLISGDLVVAEPPAEKLAGALAEKAGCRVEVRRRPAGLREVFNNLKTYSLFDPAKVILVVDSAIFSDKSAAAHLIDQAEEALPVTGELGAAGREAASRLLQALRVFGVGLEGAPADVVGALPKWALEGGAAFRKKRSGRKRTAKQAAELRDGLAELLTAARCAGIEGHAEGDLAELSEITSKGLPAGHALVLAEHAVARDHPVVAALIEQGAFLDLGKVSSGRGGEWQGLEALTRQLAEDTSVPIAPDAAAELARRTLRQTGGRGAKGIDAESTARFAGEYRKLAHQAAGGKITRRMVSESVEDRGEQDVWQILDAVGNGRGTEALSQYRRYLAGADDAISARLSFFGLLAGFCRHLTAVAGVARLRQVPPGVTNYNQFKSRWAPLLTDKLEGGANPLAGLHPFRLHRAYLTASRMDRRLLARLPWLVLETEMRLKGESSEADVALADLMARLAAAASSPSPPAAGRPRHRL